MRMMGSLLISSLIIFPAVTAKKLVQSFRSVVILSVIFSNICYIFGIICSFVFNLPTGASIVAVNIVVLCAVTMISKMRRS